MKEPSERAHIPHASTFWSQKYPDVVTQKNEAGDKISEVYN